LSTSKSRPGGGRRTDYRSKLLIEGKRQFHLRGFHATAVNDVLESVGIPKGSFYHHFGSKEKFGLAILAEDTDSQIELFKSWADRDDLPVADRFGGYVDDLIRDFVSSDCSALCLLTRFSSDVAATDPNLRSKIDEGYDRLLGAFTELLDVGVKRGDLLGDVDIDQRAGAILALTQGAFVVALANRDTAYLTGVSAVVRQLASGNVAQLASHDQGRQRPADALVDENRQLRARIAELERVIGVLRSASVYFASELGKHVDEHPVGLGDVSRSLASFDQHDQSHREDLIAEPA
jgi:TetR/AcrR family transcriptional repressor of nem operon